MNKIERIIMIDDDPSNNLMCKLLARKNLPEIEVVDFTNPLHSLSYIEERYELQGPETLVLLDINMPELSGWEVLEHLSAMTAGQITRLKIYILSSSVDQQDYDKAQQEPYVIDYLVKPLTAAKLQLICQ